MKKYDIAVCGGTFDHLHKGHKTFLLSALSRTKKLLIGLTSERYLKQHKLDSSFESYRQRKKTLEKFLQSQNVVSITEIISIHTPLIPKEWNNEQLQAIFVTEETKQGADLINEGRKKEGLPVLSVEIIPEVIAQDGNIISSSRIRNGQIDREGNTYISQKWLKKTLFLPQFLRKSFQKPFGILLKEEDISRIISQKSIVYTVGDVVSETFFITDNPPGISVVDLLVERKPRYKSLSEHSLPPGSIILKAKNPAGSLTPSLFRAVKQAFLGKKPVVILVEGEEDLAVLPVILAAPLQSIVLYGQPNVGVVKIVVTESIKNKTYNIVQKFSLKKDS